MLNSSSSFFFGAQRNLLGSAAAPPYIPCCSLQSQKSLAGQNGSVPKNGYPVKEALRYRPQKAKTASAPLPLCVGSMECVSSVLPAVDALDTC